MKVNEMKYLYFLANDISKEYNKLWSDVKLSCFRYLPIV